MAEKGEEKEIGKNCASCKKHLKRSKRYYREGDYYCNKNCYQNKKEKDAAEAAKENEAEAPAA